MNLKCDEKFEGGNAFNTNSVLLRAFHDMTWVKVKQRQTKINNIYLKPGTNLILVEQSFTIFRGPRKALERP